MMAPFAPFSPEGNGLVVSILLIDGVFPMFTIGYLWGHSILQCISMKITVVLHLDVTGSVLSACVCFKDG